MNKNLILGIVGLSCALGVMDYDYHPSPSPPTSPVNSFSSFASNVEDQLIPLDEIEDIEDDDDYGRSVSPVHNNQQRLSLPPSPPNSQQKVSPKLSPPLLQQQAKPRPINLQKRPFSPVPAKPNNQPPNKRINLQNYNYNHSSQQHQNLRKSPQSIFTLPASPSPQRIAVARLSSPEQPNYPQAVIKACAAGDIEKLKAAVQSLEKLESIKGGKFEGIDDEGKGKGKLRGSSGEGTSVLTTVKDKIGATPLHHAAWHGKVEIVKYILQVACQLDKSAAGRQPLIADADGGDLATVAAPYPASSSSPSSSTLFGKPNILQAVVNAQNEDGSTPLHWACHQGHLEIVKYLLALGAKVHYVV